MTRSEVPAERLGTATEIAAALLIPAATIRAYAHEGAITAAGRRGRQPLYDLVRVAEVRSARRATMKTWRAA